MDNIYTVAENFLIFGKCLGFYPFSFDGPSKKGIFVTKLYDVVASVVLLAIVSIYFLMILIFQGFVESGSKIVLVSWRVSISFEYFCFLILVCCQLCNRNFFKLLLSQMDAAEVKVVGKSINIVKICIIIVSF